MSMFLNIFIVNDSPVLTAVMKAIVETRDNMKVVGVAANGELALGKITPAVDVVLMDIHMPGMDGVEVTKRLLAKMHKIRILITTANIANNESWIFYALKAGAVDYVQSPGLKVTPGTRVSASDLEIAGKQLIHKLKVLNHVRPKQTGYSEINYATTKSQSTLPITQGNQKKKNYSAYWFCVGASTGGPTTLAILLKAIAKPFQGSIIICQHNEPGFTHGLAKWLQEESGFACHEVTQRINPQPGHVYIAPGGYDLIATPGNFIRPNPINKQVHYHPNIDLFLASVLSLNSLHLSAAILTGMGNDGAQGLAAVKDKGGAVYVQDEQSAIIDSMPLAAKLATGLSRGFTPQYIGQLVSQSIMAAY